MKFLRWAVAALAALTVAGNAMELARFGASGAFMARTWRCGFRSTGEHVDAARRMAENAVARGWSIAYCQPYEDRITSVDRARILAMSWATAPCPVQYGCVAELRGYDAVVASAYGFDLGSATGLGEQYRVVDSGGGLALWAKKPMAAPSAAKRVSSVSQDLFTAAVLLAIVLAFLLIGGMQYVVMGICIVSFMVFLQVVCLHSTDRVWSVVMAMIVIAAAYCFRRVWWKADYESSLACCNRSRGGRWFMIAAVACIFTVYAAFALTHTFVAPTGLGTVGGKAKLLFLSKGFPYGFFTEPSFMLYQPPYPPGGALFLLLGYVISGGCCEWIVQVVNCCLAVLLLGFLLSRSSDWPVRCLVIAFFVSPLTLRLVTLFYPEVLMGLCMLIGWDRVRRHSLDWGGWFAMGMAGWFKNEGLVYFCAMALPVFLSCRRKIRCLVTARVVCAMVLPVVWHVGSRLCGASLDGYVPIGDASLAKGVSALQRMLEYAFCAPWLYAFAFPLAIVSVFVRGRRRLKAHCASVGAGISICCFCLVFSLSGANDFAWHLDSAERLLWVPALLLLHAVAAVEGEVFARSPCGEIWYNIRHNKRKGTP